MPKIALSASWVLLLESSVSRLSLRLQRERPEEEKLISRSLITQRLTLSPRKLGTCAKECQEAYHRTLCPFRVYGEKIFWCRRLTHKDIV
jgi:hypothetical protein